MDKDNSKRGSEPMTRPCPRCGAEVDFRGNPYRPFCSRRCKMADLGAWLREEYYISSSLVDLEMDEPFGSER